MFINTVRGLYSSISIGTLPVFPMQPEKPKKIRFVGCACSIYGGKEKQWGKWGGFGIFLSILGYFWDEPRPMDNILKTTC